jgi:hypothetical protein
MVHYCTSFGYKLCFFENIRKYKFEPYTTLIFHRETSFCRQGRRQPFTLEYGAFLYYIIASGFL